MSGNEPDADAILNNVNGAINDLISLSDCGTIHAKVCLVCDRFISPKEFRPTSLKVFTRYAPYFTAEDLDIPPAIRQCYQVTIPGNIRATKLLENCLLSPRSKPFQRRSTFLMLCQECKSGLQRKTLENGILPRYAIANGMVIGDAPVCLSELNDIELSLLSQARLRGHLFSYWGGCHKSIKGWHCFYEVNPGHTIGVLDKVADLTQSENIAIVLSGPFTSEQKQRVLSKTQVNAKKIQRAYEWLRANNRLYRDLPAPFNIGQPVVIDNSHMVASENSDIETKEEIRVVFPDGKIDTGGCQDGSEFDKVIAEMRSKGRETLPYVTSKPSKKVLHDYENQNLMRAFPKQFPYGYGYHDDFSIRSAQNGFLKYLLTLSIPSFHEAAFVLVIHNIFLRSRALNGVIWRVMGGRERCDVKEEELNSAIFRQLNGLPPVNGPGTQFLQSVKSCKRNMPHTNAAAQAAQAKFISLTHHFGCAKVLFTVSFDDALDIRILALAGKSDAPQWMQRMQDLPSSELAAEMDILNALRMTYPGLCALTFDYLLEIVMEKIVKAGLFGELNAYGVVVEEQGRKTLHAHILLYIAEWNELLRDLQSKNVKKRAAAEKVVITFVDRVLSTALVPNSPTNLKCFSCGKAEISYVPSQNMRHLRHQFGCQHERGVIATCLSCQSQFQGDEIAMKRVLTKQYWDLPREDMKAHTALSVLCTTLPTKVSKNIPMVNLHFNHHLQYHTKTCFKKGSECRSYLPDLGEQKTRVMYSDKVYNVFHWSGRSVQHNNITIRPKRLPQDAYTNTYSKIISSCKAPSNSNILVTVGCRATIYASCYSSKSTQKEDTDEYKRMASYVGNRFEIQKKETALLEGLSRLMGAVIVGTSQHVCAAPMAAYIVRNGSRFQFSHEFKLVPVKGIIELLCDPSNRDHLEMSVLPHNDGCFLSSNALHYLHRPDHPLFEGMSLMTFFTKYEVIRTSKCHLEENEEAMFEFDDPDHPGFGRQLIREVHKKRKVLPQVCHWTIPDSASFGGDIRTLNTYPLPAAVENFCRTMLVLFHPFRVLSDIVVDGSYHKCFMKIYPRGNVPQEMEDFMNNAQMFYDSLRMPPKDDPLQQCSTPFVHVSTSNQNQDLDSDEESDTNDDDFTDILGLLTTTKYMCKTDDTNLCQISLLHVRKGGTKGCGFRNLPLFRNSSPPLPPTTRKNTDLSFPTSFISSLQEGSKIRVKKQQRVVGVKRDKPFVNHLMHLTYDWTRRRLLPAPVHHNSPPSMVESSGTAVSIIEWSQQSDLHLDKEQQLAFQIITAAFVVTYYDDANGFEIATSFNPQGGSTRSQTRQDFNAEKQKLRRLARLKAKQPLRMFLDGAGGSGKSRVVKEMLKYAEDYTSRLHLTFDMRTVIITAMSGVAATCIGGETLHSAACFNRCTKKDIKLWTNARLLIIDEVSFMSTAQAGVLDVKLRELLRSPNSLFGGMNILFCGDFRQLEPCAEKPLYSPHIGDKTWMHSINCYVELLGQHRFKEDPEWGRILARIRNGVSDQTDIDAINKCVVNDKSLSEDSRPIPRNASYCVYHNSDRTAINTGIFAELLAEHWSTTNTVPDHMLVIKGARMEKVGKKKTRKLPLSREDMHYIHENCGDHNFKCGAGAFGGHHVDPFLKLYYHVPLMLVSNDDVPNGYANGTRVLLEAVILKPQKVTSVVSIDGYECPTIDADAVDHIMCTQDDNPSKVFRIYPKEMTCKARVPVSVMLGGLATPPISIRIKMFQLPVIVNNATTGHKLQGLTKQCLVIVVWSKVRNWNYVALSRVTTRAGLFIVNALPYTTDFSISYGLTCMLEVLRLQTPAVIDWDMLSEHAVLLQRYAHYTNTKPAMQVLSRHVGVAQSLQSVSTQMPSSIRHATSCTTANVDMERFLDAQKLYLQQALIEVHNGKPVKARWCNALLPKLPYLDEGGKLIGPLKSNLYALRSSSEVKAFLKFEVGKHCCRQNYITLIDALTMLGTNRKHRLREVLGYPNYLNMLSSVQLFASVGSTPEHNGGMHDRDIYQRCVILLQVCNHSFHPTTSSFLQHAVLYSHTSGSVNKKARIGNTQKLQSVPVQIKVRPLRPEEHNRVRVCLLRGLQNSSTAVVSRIGTNSISYASMLTLLPGYWINDEIINAYMALLNSRELLQTIHKTHHCFNSFFVTSLLSGGRYNYNSVRRWSGNIPLNSIFKLQKLFIPINIRQTHWTCALINFDRCTIQYFDSMGDSGTTYLQYLLWYIRDEYRHHNNNQPLPDLNTWQLIPGNKRSAVQQNNNCDCGVIVCALADCFLRNVPAPSSHEQLEGLRAHLMLSLATKDVHANHWLTAPTVDG